MKETIYTLLCLTLITSMFGCDDLDQKDSVDLPQVGGETPHGEMEGDLAGDEVEQPLAPNGGSTGAGETPYEAGEEMMSGGGAINGGEGGEMSEAGTEMMSEAGTEMMTEAGTEMMTEAGTEMMTEAGTEVMPEAGTEVMTEAGVEMMPEAGAEMMAGSEGGGRPQACLSDDDCEYAERCTVDATCEPIVAVALQFCRLQFPLEISTAESGGLTTVYGRLYHAGITDLSPNTDPTPLVLAEVGYGPDGVIPDETWRWREATPNAYYDGSTLGGNEANNDEYMGEMVTPDVGQYDFAFRFSVDRGVSWTICDFGFSGAGSSDGYSPEDAGQLNVF